MVGGILQQQLARRHQLPMDGWIQLNGALMDLFFVTEGLHAYKSLQIKNAFCKRQEDSSQREYEGTRAAGGQQIKIQSDVTNSLGLHAVIRG